MMQLWRNVRFSLLVTLGFFPVALVLTAFGGYDFLPWIWVWPVSGILRDWLRTKVKGKWRIAFAVLELVFMAGLTLWMDSYRQNFLIFGVAALYVVLWFLILPLTEAEKTERILLLKYVIVGMVLHVVAQFFVYINGLSIEFVLQAVAPWLSGTFLIFAVLGLTLLNQANLKLISGGRLQVFQNMQKKNALLTLVFTGLAVAVALIPAVIGAVSTVFQWVVGLVKKLIELLQWKKLPSTEIGVTGGATPSGTTNMPISSGNAMPEWADGLIQIVVILLVTVAVAFLLRFLVRKLIIFVKFLGKVFNQYVHTTSEDYIDEITDTREDGELSKKREKREKKLSSSELRKLSPDQQIRYRYRLLLSKHPEWARSSTARENLQADTASVYERARYSQKPITEDEAGLFAEQTKRI